MQNDDGQLQGEAEESDNDFIDDDEPDESDSDAAAEVRSAVASLRNRHAWTVTKTGCAVCKDLQLILRHILQSDESE